MPKGSLHEERISALRTNYGLKLKVLFGKDLQDIGVLDARQKVSVIGRKVQ